MAHFKKNLLLTTALVTASVVPHEAKADCTFQATVGNTVMYVCSGLTAGSVEIKGSNNISAIVGDATFSVEGELVFGGQMIAGMFDQMGSISFTDTFASVLENNTGDISSAALMLQTWGDGWGDAGSLTINSNSQIISDGYGIVTRMNSATTGDTTITFDGSIDSYGGGIKSMHSGNNLIITLGENGSIISGKGSGIEVASYSGSGDVNITVNGAINAYRNGIVVTNKSTDADIIIVTGDQSLIDVQGQDTAISVLQEATGGGIDVTIGGKVYGEAYNGALVHLYNQYGTGLSFTAAKGSKIEAEHTAISLHNERGDMTVQIDGEVRSTGVDPVYGFALARGVTAYNGDDGGDMIVTTGQHSHIEGMNVMSTSAANTNVETSGFISQYLMVYNRFGRSYLGPGDLTVTTKATSEISGYGAKNALLIINENVNADLNVHIQGKIRGYTGITVSHGGNASWYNMGVPQGKNNIVIDGDVGGVFSGIRGYNTTYGAGLNVTLTKNAVVSGGYDGVLLSSIRSYAAFNQSHHLTVDAGARVTGGSRAAVNFTSVGTFGMTIDTSGDLVAGSSGVAVQFSYAVNDYYNCDYYGNNCSSKAYPSLSASTLNIHGGRIVGDVIDMSPNREFADVNVKGDFTAEGNFDVSNFSVAKGATFTAGQNTTVKTSAAASDILGTFRVVNDTAVLGGINNRGTLALESGNLTVDTMTAGATGNIVIGVTSATDHGLLTITGGAAQMTNQTVSVNLAPVNTLADGAEILVIDGTGTVVGGPAMGTDGTVVSSGSPIWTFSLRNGADVTGGDDSQLYLLASKAAPAAQIEVDGAIVAATLTFADTSMNLTGERLSNLRRGAISGVAAGDGQSGARVWMQALGQHIDQKDRKGVAGYDANLYGGSVGVDTDRYLTNGVLGLSFSYGQSDIKSADTFNSKTLVDSYQVTLYGDYNWADGMYVEGMGAYGFNKNDKTRHNAGGLGLDAKSDFDSHSVALRGEVGRTFKAGSAFVTPFAMANWLYYTADSYTETGAGMANLHVKSKDMQQVDLGLGAKLGMEKAINGGLLIPELHAVYRRDLLGEKLSTTQSYVAGGSPAVVAESPDPARNKLTLGARVKYYSEGGFELTGAYDFDVKEDFTSHTGLLRAGWRF